MGWGVGVSWYLRGDRGGLRAQSWFVWGTHVSSLRSPMDERVTSLSPLGQAEGCPGTSHRVPQTACGVLRAEIIINVQAEREKVQLWGCSYVAGQPWNVSDALEYSGHKDQEWSLSPQGSSWAQLSSGAQTTPTVTKEHQGELGNGLIRKYSWAHLVLQLHLQWNRLTIHQETS